MLRITNAEGKDSVALRLEGRLTGPWVTILRDCWQQAVREEGREIQVDLTAVTFVDGAGKALLAEMSASNAQFIARDCQMRAILTEITANEA